MTGLTDLLADFLSSFSSVLGSWSFTRDLAEDINSIMPYWHKANYLLPVSETLTVLTLFITLQLVLMAYYWITRAINLIRGAG